MNRTATSYRPMRSSVDLSGAAVSVHRQPPPPDLADGVLEFWQYDVAPEQEYLPIQVFPSGCVVLRFNIRAEGVEPILYGPSLRNDMKGIFYHDWVIFGVALRADRACQFLGLSLAEFRDKRLLMDAVWPTRIESVCAQMWETRCFADRIGVLSRFLRTVRRPDLAPSADFLNVFGDIVGRPCAEDIGKIAKRYGANGRSTRRHFSKCLGIGPKELERLVRVQRAMRALHCQPKAALTHLTNDAGFCDQPHFSREFKRLVGVSPGTFASLVGRMHDKSLPAWSKLDPRWREKMAPEVVRF